MLNNPDHIILAFVARHGSTALNGGPTPRFRGHNDVALDAAGTRDAHKLASLFDNIDVSHIVSSDMQRARQTAKIIADRKEMPVRETSTIRPWDVGEFSGQPKDKENREKLEEYIDNPNREVPGGESLEHFKSRVRPAIADALKIADNAGAPILVVAHSSIVHEVGSMFHDNHEAILVEPGGVIAIYAADGKISAEPVYKPRPGSIGSMGADTVS